MVAVVMTAVVCLASCSKKCTCKNYFGGDELGQVNAIKLDAECPDCKNCSDMTNLTITDPAEKTGKECFDE